MRLRVPIAAAALVLASAGLAGCRTNVGTAADIDGHRISESSVNSYARPAGQSASVVAQAASQGTKLLPAKTIIVQYLVQRQVFRSVLAKNGGVPSSTTLARTNTGDTVAKLSPQLGPVGIDTSFASVIVETDALKAVFVDRLKIGSLEAAVAAVKKAGVTVSVNSRYGSWEPSQLTVNAEGAVPSYLTLHSDAATTGVTG